MECHSHSARREGGRNAKARHTCTGHKLCVRNFWRSLARWVLQKSLEWELLLRLTRLEIKVEPLEMLETLMDSPRRLQMWMGCQRALHKLLVLSPPRAHFWDGRLGYFEAADQEARLSLAESSIPIRGGSVANPTIRPTAHPRPLWPSGGLCMLGPVLSCRYRACDKHQNRGKSVASIAAWTSTLPTTLVWRLG